MHFIKCGILGPRDYVSNYLCKSLIKDLNLKWYLTMNNKIAYNMFFKSFCSCKKKYKCWDCHQLIKND